jgi:metallo-beta-lactamase class B
LLAEYAPAVPEWNRPVEPFRILGNLFYVGASGVSSFLFTTPEGHILLDSGFRETVPLIEANFKKLGFRLEDIRLMLTSHAHYDHVAGVAEIKQRTKARLLANPVEVDALGRGGRGDFALGDKYPFPPVKVDAMLHDGTPVKLGSTALTPHFTPGHTKGSTTWTTRIEDAGRTYDVVIAGSLSAPGYRLIGNREYPDIVRDYEASFTKVRALPCDVFLSLHGWDFDLDKKRAALAEGAKQNPFIDPGGCARYVDRMRSALQKQLDQQRTSPPA